MYHFVVYCFDGAALNTGIHVIGFSERASTIRISVRFFRIEDVGWQPPGTANHRYNAVFH
jgi:hypothetical protein